METRIILVENIIKDKKNKKNLEIIFSAIDGHYDISIPKEKAEKIGFSKGQRYIGIIESYESSDMFVTPRGISREDVATISNILSKVETIHGELIYERKREKDTERKII